VTRGAVKEGETRGSQWSGCVGGEQQQRRRKGAATSPATRACPRSPTQRRLPDARTRSKGCPVEVPVGPPAAPPAAPPARPLPPPPPRALEVRREPPRPPPPPLLAPSWEALRTLPGPRLALQRGGEAGGKQRCDKQCSAEGGKNEAKGVSRPSKQRTAAAEQRRAGRTVLVGTTATSSHERASEGRERWWIVKRWLRGL